MLKEQQRENVKFGVLCYIVFPSIIRGSEGNSKWISYIDPIKQFVYISRLIIGAYMALRFLEL